MGNPHAVLRVRSVATRRSTRVGPAMENHAAFPAPRERRLHARSSTPGHIRLRVFERGVGETLACGTGACAAVAVGRAAGSSRATSRWTLPGGRLDRAWAGPGDHIWLTGPAETAFEGQVEILDAPRRPA